MRTALRFSLLLARLQLAALLTWEGNPLAKSSLSAVSPSKAASSFRATSLSKASSAPIASSALKAESSSSKAVSSATQAFGNTLLVVHCRLKAKEAKGLEGICEERLHLFHGYRRYFADVLYITREECPVHGDPHLCVAKIMQGPGASRDGVFYMHFDALIRPQHLAASFNKNKMAAFNSRHWCEINKVTLEQEHCNCVFWDPKRTKWYQRAIAKLRNSSSAAFANLDPWQFWTGNDDMFYVPRRFYNLYGQMAKAFEFVQHEVAGPTMRTILENATSVPVLNLNCTGSCCTQLLGEVTLQSDFRCGHAFDLSQRKIRNFFPKAISTYRSRRMPLDDWSAVVQAALE